MKKTIFLAIGLLAILGLGLAIAQEAPAGDNAQVVLDDPFAGLGAADDTGLAIPDGSSSIRAKKKVDPRIFKGRVEIVKTDEKVWPRVYELKIKVLTPPSCKKGAHPELKKGQSYDFTVNWNRKDGKFDFNDANNKYNIGIYYMQKGDKIEGMIKEKKDGKFILEYLKRS